MSRVRDFDDAIRTLTQDRGRVYSHPLDNFACINHLKKGVKDCPHDGVRHCLEIIAVKMARLVHTPDHLDSILDIGGYARCIAMIHDEEERRENEHADKQETENTNTEENPGGAASSASKALS